MIVTSVIAFDFLRRTGLVSGFLEFKGVLMLSNFNSLSRRARDDLEHLGQPIPNGKIPEKLYGMQVMYHECTLRC